MFCSRYFLFLTLALCVLTPVWWWKVARRRSASSIEFATYNIWNVMFNWDVRKHRIAEIIQTRRPAVIGLQEVRESDGQSQLEELQALLPDYKWAAFQWTTNAVDQEAVKMGRQGIETGSLFYREGLAILSRWPITSWGAVNLTVGAQDQNIRILLTARIEGPFFPFTFAVTHMSYEKNTQCHNVIEIRNHLASLPKPTVLVGDTNTYNDFEDPILHLSSDDPTSSTCAQAQAGTPLPFSNDALFDAWSTVHGTEPGFTFSNMPSPGMQSRPDRILLSKTWPLLDVFREGDGSIYKRDFWWNVMYARFRTAMANDKECVFDCGPYAKCVCGICVKGATPCPVPCATCAGADRALFTFVAAPSVLVMCYIFVRMLCRGRNNHRVVLRPRYGGAEKVEAWKKVALAVSVVAWVFIVWRLSDQPALNHLYDVVTRVIAEEMFPSDHLFVSASISHRL